MGSNQRHVRNVLVAGAAAGDAVRADGDRCDQRGAAPRPRSTHTAAPAGYVTGLTSATGVAPRLGRRDARHPERQPTRGLLFRNVPPGSGYRVQAVDDGPNPARSRCTPRGRAVGPGDYNQPIAEQRLHSTSRPVTAPSSPSTSTHRRARASPASRGTTLPTAPTTSAVPDADRVLGLRLRRPGRHRRAASRCSRT